MYKACTYYVSLTYTNKNIKRIKESMKKKVGNRENIQ